MSSDKNVQRQTIVWDMDDTLAHFVSPVLKELARVTGRVINRDEMIDGRWLSHFLTEEELETFLPNVFNPTFYSRLEPTSLLRQWGSSEHSRLREVFDHHVVTARSMALGRQAHRVTCDWLHYKGVHMDGITICHPDQLKTQVLPSNAVAIVDDSGKVVLDAASHGVIGFLVDQPWNRHIKEDENTNVYRVTHDNAMSVIVRTLGL